VKQIAIVTPDVPGLVVAVTAALAAEGIGIETFDAETTGPTAVIRLTVRDDYDRAVRALHAAGYRPVTEDALLVRLEDRPGALAEVSRRFRDAGVNVRSLRIIHTAGGQTVAAVAVDDPAAAAAVVRDILIS
jgi:hypothetical protein